MPLGFLEVVLVYWDHLRETGDHLSMGQVAERLGITPCGVLQRVRTATGLGLLHPAPKWCKRDQWCRPTEFAKHLIRECREARRIVYFPTIGDISRNPKSKLPEARYRELPLRAYKAELKALAFAGSRYRASEAPPAA